VPKRCFPLHAAAAASLLILSACAQTEGPVVEQRAAQQRAEAERTEAYRQADELREKARLAELEKTDPERARRTVERTAARKKTCGDDYRAPRIGMTLERAMQCVGQFRLATQSNRAGGMLSTYHSDALYIEEYGGRLVGWGLR
jgi:hypothetical protein